MIVVGRPGRQNQMSFNHRDDRQERTGEEPMTEAEPTPADDDVPPEVFLLENKGESQQGLQVHPLHQQPEVVGQDAELEERHGRFTGSLQEEKQPEPGAPLMTIIWSLTNGDGGVGGSGHFVVHLLTLFFTEL